MASCVYVCMYVPYGECVWLMYMCVCMCPMGSVCGCGECVCSLGCLLP